MVKSFAMICWHNLKRLKKVIIKESVGMKDDLCFFLALRLPLLLRGFKWFYIS